MGLVLGERLLQEEWSSLGTQIMGFRISTWTVGIASDEIEAMVHHKLWIPLCEKITESLDARNQIRYGFR